MKILFILAIFVLINLGIFWGVIEYVDHISIKEITLLKDDEVLSVAGSAEDNVQVLVKRPDGTFELRKYMHSGANVISRVIIKKEK